MSGTQREVFFPFNRASDVNTAILPLSYCVLTGDCLLVFQHAHLIKAGPRTSFWWTGCCTHGPSFGLFLLIWPILVHIRPVCTRRDFTFSCSYRGKKTSNRYGEDGGFVAFLQLCNAWCLSSQSLGRGTVTWGQGDIIKLSMAKLECLNASC